MEGIPGEDGGRGKEEVQGVNGREELSFGE